MAESGISDEQMERARKLTADLLAEPYKKAEKPKKGFRPLAEFGEAGVQVPKVTSAEKWSGGPVKKLPPVRMVGPREKSPEEQIGS